MKWVVRILLTDSTWVLHGPFDLLSAAEGYAARYAAQNPKVGTEVMGLHMPWSAR